MAAEAGGGEIAVVQLQRSDGSREDLRGYVAIVTGPTPGGIGYETAKSLAVKGAHVILAGKKADEPEARRAEPEV